MHLFSLLSAAALAQLTPVADTSPTARFDVGGVALALPLPKGYCLPQDKQIDVAKMIAAADSGSATLVTLMQCGIAISDGANDYTLVKSPNAALTMTIDRPQLLASLGAEFDKPETLAYLQSDAFDKSVSDDVGKVIPGKPQFDNQIKPLGRDDVCGYLGGTTDVKSELTSYKQAVGTCITSIKGRVIAVNRYGVEADDKGVAKLLREARDLALAIR